MTHEERQPREQDTPMRRSRETLEQESEDGESELRRIERFSHVAPPTNHRLVPATSIHDISHLAGFGGAGGHDSLEGIDAMVMGDVDAMKELEVDDGTPGPNLALGPRESIFSEDTPEQDHLDMAFVGGLVDVNEVDWRRWL